MKKCIIVTDKYKKFEFELSQENSLQEISDRMERYIKGYWYNSYKVLINNNNTITSAFYNNGKWEV